MFLKIKELTVSSACWLGDAARKSAAALLLMVFVMTAQSAMAKSVMYVIAEELYGTISVHQRDANGSFSKLDAKQVKLTFYYGERPTDIPEGKDVWSKRTTSIGGRCIFDVPTTADYPAWYVSSLSKDVAERNEAVTFVYFDDSFASARPTTTAYWFYGLNNAEFSDLDELNTSSVKNMKYMFAYCRYRLRGIENWDVSNVTNMSYMFDRCTGIKKLDLSGWKVSKVTNMTEMFRECTGLQTLNLLGWNVTKLSNTSYMFSGCSSLKTIFCNGNWNKSTLKTSTAMFSGCTSLPGFKKISLTKTKARPKPDGYFTAFLTYNKDGYYEVNSEQDLNLLGEYSHISTCDGMTFKLTRDLDFTDAQKKNGANFTPIGVYEAGISGKIYFRGHFDGQGHSIKGLYLSNNGLLGLFFCVNGNACLENIVLIDPQFYTKDEDAIACGCIVGAMQSETTVVRNCTVFGGSISGGCYGAAIAGLSKGTIDGCAVIGTEVDGLMKKSLICCDAFSKAVIKNCVCYNPNGYSFVRYMDSYKDGGGNKSLYQLSLNDDATAVNAVYMYDGKAYYVEGAKVTLGSNARTGYTATTTYKSDDVTISDGTFSMPAKDITVSALWTKNVMEMSDATDIYSFVAANTDKVYDLTLANRTLYRDGDWNTICLPFDQTIAGSVLDGAEARELASASINGSTLNLNFSEPVSKLTAGKPYIIKWAKGSDISNPVFTGVTVSDANNDFESEAGDVPVRFVGTYEKKVFNDEDKTVLFLGANNHLYYPDGKGTTTIGACRAYFKIGDDNNTFNARQLTGFNLNTDSETTSIATDLIVLGDESAAWYSLDGRKLSQKPTEKGVYIVNGRKVVIK